MVQASGQQIAAHPGLSSADSTAVTRDQARAVFGQVAACGVADRAEAGDERARGAGGLPHRRRLGLDIRAEGAQRKPQEQAESEHANRGKHLPGRPEHLLFFLQLFGGDNE
jgi:hypothetical protein